MIIIDHRQKIHIVNIIDWWEFFFLSISVDISQWWWWWWLFILLFEFYKKNKNLRKSNQKTKICFGLTSLFFCLFIIIPQFKLISTIYILNDLICMIKRKFVQMFKQIQMGLKAFLLFTARVWSCICYSLKKQTRAVSYFFLFRKL